LRFLIVVGSHHMGSAERCQAAGIPDATREVKLPKRASARGGETTKVEDFA
jgi:hypothetical protein